MAEASTMDWFTVIRDYGGAGPKGVEELNTGLVISNLTLLLSDEQPVSAKKQALAAQDLVLAVLTERAHKKGPNPMFQICKLFEQLQEQVDSA
jgi:hypothetical protein